MIKLYTNYSLYQKYFKMCENNTSKIHVHISLENHKSCKVTKIVLNPEIVIKNIVTRLVFSKHFPCTPKKS